MKGKVLTFKKDGRVFFSWARMWAQLRRKAKRGAGV